MRGFVSRVFCYLYAHDWPVRMLRNPFTDRYPAWMYLVAALLTASSAREGGWSAGVEARFQNDCPRVVEHDPAFWRREQLERRLYLPPRSAIESELKEYDAFRDAAWLCQ